MQGSFTVVMPMPGFIPRQLALDILHSHGKVMTLDPLILDHKQNMLHFISIGSHPFCGFPMPL